MYLKHLEIQGFKSFADRTVFDCHPGITVVVGPNGSGKSNISDAIRWVLGEQSAKSLRGGKMEDVIFAGTQHRKPVGFAEVTLTLDNSDGALPVEYTEVTITRRIFRSGESEFYINKTPCRLKDIQDLFLDTGIGKDGYSIIGQGRIDEILSTSSSDRRLVFEEASGIMKYKVRKIEAERKLEQTRQNLLRLNDIISELESQLGPLEKQAEVARKYLAAREKLKEIEVNVFIENIGRMKEKLDEYQKQCDQIKSTVDSFALELEKCNSELEDKQTRTKGIEEQYESLRQQCFDIDNAIERYRSEIQVSKEKISHGTGTNARLQQEIREIEGMVEKLEKEKQMRMGRLEVLERNKAEYQAMLESAEKKLEQVMSKIDSEERYIEELKGKILEKMEQASEYKSRAQGIKSFIENVQKRSSTIAEEQTLLKLDKDKLLLQAEELEESILNTKGIIEKDRQDILSLNKGLLDLENENGELQKKGSQLRGSIQSTQARMHLLEEMEKSLEGYSRSVKSILQACSKSGELGDGIHGALAQLITVEHSYETAIETALGGALQNIVTETEEAAKKAIQYLKENRLGRATFLPISAVKGHEMKEYIDELKKCSGFIGIASELVQCHPRYRGIIQNLLGRVAVVDNLDSGIRIARQFRYGFRIVTLDGDLINPSGAMTGGSVEHKSASLLGRSREINDLKKKLEELQLSYDEWKKKTADLESRKAQLEETRSRLDKRIRENELVIVRDESHLAKIREDFERTGSRLDMIEAEKEQLADQRKKAEEELSGILLMQKQCEDEMEQFRAQIAEYQQRQKNEQVYRDNIHKEITDLKISIGSIAESMESARENIDRLDREIRGHRKSIEKRENDISSQGLELNQLEKSINELENKIRELTGQKDMMQAELERLAGEKKGLEEDIRRLNENIRDRNRSIQLLTEEYNRLEVRKTKLEVEKNNLQNRLWDEYELTYNNALEYKKDIGSLPQAQKLIEELRSQIRELGPVNVGAIDEYVKTKERFEFLAMQRSDMEKSAEKLERIIREMTSIMKKQFAEEFAKINESFGQVFQELFGGGKGELRLVDSDNVLESDIEIVVQPPGKKLQNMMLLSGGERAFTAIALLFAILRLRPSPFCVLDEIEAALDDANVYRFAEYLKRYSKNNQFIVITHRKGTMEVADSLYGAAMQEHGVSKLVSLRLSEQAS